MSCPNCKMSLGWQEAEYRDPGVPWYKPTELVIRCKFCGARFRAEPDRNHLALLVLSLMAAGFVYLEQGFAGWGKWVMGALLGVVVVLNILRAIQPLERID